MDKERFSKEVKEFTSTEDLLEIRKICFDRAVEVIDSKDMSTRDKINELLPHCNEVYDYLPDDGNWPDITDYINGGPNRNEMIYLNYLCDWIDDASEYEDWLEDIYAMAKEGYKGFIWDW